MLSTNNSLDHAFVLSISVKHGSAKILALSKSIVPCKTTKKRGGRNQNCCDTWKRFVRDDEECEALLGARVSF